MSVEDKLEEWLHEEVKDKLCFTERMKIYTPTCYGKCEHAVEKLVGAVNQIYGGSTVYDAEGSWFNEKKKVVETEPVKVIEVGHHCTDRKSALELARAITYYASEAKQKELGVFQGKFYLTKTPELQTAYKALKKKERGF